MHFWLCCSSPLPTFARASPSPGRATPSKPACDPCAFPLSCGSRSHLHQLDLHVSFSAMSQPIFKPLDLKKSLLFGAVFLARGHPRLLGYLGLVVEGCETNWAREENWSLTRLGGISLWAVGGRRRYVPQQRPLDETQPLTGQYFSVGG